MDYSGLVCVDLDSKMSNRNESETKEESKEEPRARAGFDWAAEPDEMLFPCCATKFVMLGIAAVLTLFSILNWIFSAHYSGFVWVTVETLFMCLIIFLPEYFCNLINFAVNFCVWVAFTIFCFAMSMKSFVERGDVPENGIEYNRVLRRQLLMGGIFGLVEMALAILVCLLMFRMLYHFYLNRGDDNIVAVAA